MTIISSSYVVMERTINLVHQLIVRHCDICKKTMMECKVLFTVLFVLFGVSRAVADFIGNDSIGKRYEYLDSEGLYLVEWEAYLDTKSVVFELTVETTGFVGFGISPNGGMTGADIIIAGVHSNGSTYISNRHGVGNQMPEVDGSETWKLLAASENATHTYLKVGRLLNTCNDEDVAIGNSTSNFIWSFGQDDVIAYHKNNRGSSANNILDPAMPPTDTSDLKLWRMTNTIEMPPTSTTYWCTVHKSPPLSVKHHIVGFRPLLMTPEALSHTHHFIVHKCRAPEGSSDEETFDHFVGQPGGDCNNSPDVPRDYCETYQFIWAVGGKTVIYPDHVGYPFAVDGKPSYYLLEIHFDNPNNLQGVEFESGLELFYTSKLREYDAGTIQTGHVTSWAITIPPRSEHHIVAGHCSPSCSNNIPVNGINVFNILLHSHLAGRKLKLRHFRNGVELPWLSSDDNYNFDYQQNRPLLEEIQILPGDQLTCECTYNSMLANRTVLGGSSTTEEMCLAFLWYYPEIELDACGSELPKSKLLTEFGIESIRSSKDPLITAPANMANKTYTQVLDTMIQWTDEYRDHFQQEIRYGEQSAVCGMTGTHFTTDTIKYPNILKEYTPMDECAPKDENVTGTANKQTVLKSMLYFMSCILVIIRSFTLL